MSEILQRDVDVLSLLISEYISTAAPVGSQSIASHSSIGLSSATIRNTLAKLEDMGLLTHPHTSAGRLPTTSGLKFYINTILSRRELDQDEQRTITGHFSHSMKNIEDVLNRAGKILSVVSNYTGLVIMPKPKDVTFKHIEFHPLYTGKVLGIFVSREGLVHNRIIEVSDELSYPELEKIANYCNAAFYGLSLEDAASKAGREFDEVKNGYDRLLTRALLWSKGLLEDAGESELLIHGESKFLSEPEFTDIAKLKSIMNALEEKKGIIHILNRAAESDEVSVFIGAESGIEAVANCSIVTSPYKKNGKIVGTLGVIGPTRMNYSHVIPTIDFTGKLVSEMIKD